MESSPPRTSPRADMLPLEWISEDEDEQELEQTEAVTQRYQTESDHHMPGVTPLEQLAPDVSALILQHLSVQEISTAALVSRALYHASRNPNLWLRKFRDRWNVEVFSNTGKQEQHHDWFESYQQAYGNTHDLWITHWNCVEPNDGLGPGRCCIQVMDDQRSFSPSTDDDKTSSSHVCPTCRYQGPISPRSSPPCTIHTRAQAIAAATDIRIRQFGQPFSTYSPRRARRAFSRASTLHRQITTCQYQTQSLHFLYDLLFFQVNDDPKEFDELKHLVSSEERHPHEASEIALHSWHCVHFTNPDYNRPLVWRISIQRPDCFAVFPSEGYLQPGETKSVVFGVKPLASLLAHATQQLNAHREGVDEFWASVYTEEAHLPTAPFLIHYHFASVVPCRRAGDEASNGLFHTPLINEARPRHQLPRNRQSTAQNESNTTGAESETPWQQSAQPQQPVRTMYLSAHVNVGYSLKEFRRQTLVPFSVHQHPNALLYCAPQLQELYPSVWKTLENLELEIQAHSVLAQAYRTESPCSNCGHAWGARLEELGQSYVVCKLECELEKQQLDEGFRRIHCILKHLLQVQAEQIEPRHLVHCYGLHKKIVDARCIPWLSRQQREVLLQWETRVDRMCLEHHLRSYADKEPGGPPEPSCLYIPWRHAGVYRHILCTDSVFSDGRSVLTGEEDTPWKEEPKYLEAFCHLAHSPGRFCLGPQEDPNHLLPQQRHSRYGRRQRGCVTDIFMDNPICGLQSALCVISDPRSLMVHGIYDRVAYPGSLVRRPRMSTLPPLEQIPSPPKVSLPRLITSKMHFDYCQLQNGLDMESWLLVDSWCQQSLNFPRKTYNLSFENFLHNVPPPGAGRFALSRQVEPPKEHQVEPEEHGTVENTLPWIDELRIDRNELLKEHVAPNVHRANVEPGVTENRRTFPAHRRIPHFQNLGLHGRPVPSILNLLWVLSTHLGWTVDDNQGAASVFVDRRILIGAQWLSISLMVAPLFWTLFARYVQWIPATPVDYTLDALPFRVDNELRFLTERECGYASMVLLFSWLVLGRWIERYTSRDFFRAMLEHVPFDENSNRGIFARMGSRVSLWWQRRWDSAVPLFLQRYAFVPKWNRRSRSDLMKHVAYWRSQDHADQWSAFRAMAGRGLVFFETQNRQIHLAEESSSRKLLIGVVVAIGSFSASSPHFFLNLITVFSCSISLGLSMSLQSMETGRAGVTVSTTGSIIKALSLVTIVIIGFLVGQLVGSSGGVLFLAEFVVTSISLVLGGAGFRISPSAMESWGVFFCLSIAAFWGYLFGRVAIMEGIRQKKSGFSSTMLCVSLAILAILWFVATTLWEWEMPVHLVIVRPTWKEFWNSRRKFEPRQLQ